MLFVLLGCATWFDKGTACEHQAVYTWSDDLLTHVLQGEGEGTFDYDPIDKPRERISGNYDFESGDFWWDEDFDGDYFLSSIEVEGYGTAFHNGDLDLLYTETTVDVLDEEVVTDYRVLREGCDVNIASWDHKDEEIEDAFVQEGEYTSDDLLEWEASDQGVSYIGTLEDDLTRTLSIELDDGSYEAWTESDPDGTSTGGWIGECGDGLVCEVEQKVDFDGSVTETWKVLQDGDPYATGEAEYDYDGSGELELDYGSVLCTYTYKSSGKCTYSCDDGSEGDC